MTSTVETTRIALPVMGEAVLERLLAGDRLAAGRLLDCRIADDVDLGAMPLARRLRQLREDPTLEPWLLRAIVDRASNAMVGRINFHSRPAPADLAEVAPDGVEFGYSVEPAHRRRGYAREAIEAMMRWAFAAHDQRTFVLTISPTNAASMALAAALGFVATGHSKVDDVDGLELFFVRRLDGEGSGSPTLAA